MGGYTLGLDVGSSSVKASVLEIDTGRIISGHSSPAGDAQELPITAPRQGWAQQDPNTWWEHSKTALAGALTGAKVSGTDIEAIGVDYQMHGMTPLDVNGKPLMDAIIWCDGRTNPQKYSVESDKDLAKRFLNENLNLPGHFTASKLAWFKTNMPRLYEQLDTAVLPGHYILRRATGEKTTTASGLSEGILWSFKDMMVSSLTIDHFGLNAKHIPPIKPTFGEHGRLTRAASEDLGLGEGTPFTYFAGDQPGNAFSLNVLEPGEIAATAGTGAVIYGITDQAISDPRTRVNQFLHVNSSTQDASHLRIGILACINGAGLSNRYFKTRLGGDSYQRMNSLAASVKDTDGLLYVPFGNGPERTQQDNNTGAHLIGLDLNRHAEAHIYRAVQEGVVYAMKHGADVMQGMGMPINRVRAGHANMFLSPLFSQLFSDCMQAPLELFDTDGSAGAARGSAVGLGKYEIQTAFNGLQKIRDLEPARDVGEQYQRWCSVVQQLSR